MSRQDGGRASAELREGPGLRFGERALLCRWEARKPVSSSAAPESGAGI